MVQEVVDHVKGKLLRLIVAFLNMFASFGSHVQRDVAYAPGSPHRADIYRPDGAGSHPVIVFLYGGGWRGGSKEAVAFVGAAFARRGLAAVIPEYGHFPAESLSGILAENAAAVAWTIAHAAEFGGDPRRVIVAGHSSGAWAAAMLALDPRWLEQAGSKPDALAGVIGLSGPYSVSSLTEQADRDVFAVSGPDMEPIAHAAGHHPSILLLAGTADMDVLPGSTVALSDKLRAAGRTTTMHLYAGLNHDDVIRAVSPPFSTGSSIADDIEHFASSAWSLDDGIDDSRASRRALP